MDGGLGAGSCCIHRCCPCNCLPRLSEPWSSWAACCACCAFGPQFVQAVMARWPNAVLQFEDFSMEHALLLLERYRRHHLVFNDDIQVHWEFEIGRV